MSGSGLSSAPRGNINDYTYTASGAAARAGANDDARARLDADLIDCHVPVDRRRGRLRTGCRSARPQAARSLQPDSRDNFSATVTGLPTNGSTIYVRLWSFISGSWQNTDYTYTATTAAAAAPGEGDDAPAWIDPDGVNSAVPVDGRSRRDGLLIVYGRRRRARTTCRPGPRHQFERDGDGLPTDGSTLYVQLWSLTDALAFRVIRTRHSHRRDAGHPPDDDAGARSTLTASTVSSDGPPEPVCRVTGCPWAPRQVERSSMTRTAAQT